MLIGGFGQKCPSDCKFQQNFQRICGSNKSDLIDSDFAKNDSADYGVKA